MNIFIINKERYLMSVFFFVFFFEKKEREEITNEICHNLFYFITISITTAIIFNLYINAFY